jgi:putative addiction module component (TIGR02574 family)
MDSSARKIEAQALQLPPKERARLAQRLIASLDPESERDAEQVWLEEAERRLDEIESGKVAGIPAEQVLEKARSTLR